MKKIIGFACLLCFLSTAAYAATSNVTLAWDHSASADVTGYRIYHATTPGGPYTLAGSVGYVTTWTHAGLADGPHYWVATATDAVGNESGYSNEVTVTTDTTAPAPPGGVRVTITIRVE